MKHAFVRRSGVLVPTSLPLLTMAPMNQSNIINISLETLNVKIPMLFSADINAYEMYLKQRLEVNQ